MDETHQIGAGFYPTTNTLFAAALTTMGVPFCSEKGIDATSNIYSEQKPFRRDAKGDPLPGEVTYYLALGSETCGLPVNKLADAFLHPKADVALDEALAALSKAMERTPVLKKQVDDIIKLLPLAIMAYARGFADNRARLADEWRNATPFLRFSRGDLGSRLISKKKYDGMTAQQKKEFLSR